LSLRRRKRFESGAAGLGLVLGIPAAGAAGLLGTGAAARGALEGARYAQKEFSPMFGSNGPLAGRSVEDVAQALRSGALRPGDVSVHYIVRDGNTLILNTRSAQALERAGIPRGKWNATDMTGDVGSEARLTAQLRRNGLNSQGIPNVVPRGIR
jgi:hypothetical protein